MGKSIMLHCITSEELKQIIKEVIKEELLEVRKQLQEKDSDVILSREEASELFKVSLTTLWQWTKKGIIIGYRTGNRVYYKKDELLERLIRMR